MSELSKPVEEDAAERGLQVVPSDDWHLQLDIDRPYKLLDIKDDKLAEVERLFYGESGMFSGESLITTSQHGNHHRYLRLSKPLPLPVRIALQALMGSDPVREMLSLLRAYGCTEDLRTPQLVLFETDEEVGKAREFVAKSQQEEKVAA